MTAPSSSVSQTSAIVFRHWGETSRLIVLFSRRMAKSFGDVRMYETVNIRLYDTVTGDVKSTLSCNIDNSNCDCTFSDSHELEEVNPTCPVYGHLDKFLSVDWNSDDTTLVSDSRDKTVRIWSVGLGPRWAGTQGGKFFFGHSDPWDIVFFNFL